MGQDCQPDFQKQKELEVLLPFIVFATVGNTVTEVIKIRKKLIEEQKPHKKDEAKGGS